jgi:hypothetical protein
MMINEKIEEELLRNDIDVLKGLIFLLCLFYKINTDEVIDFDIQTKVLSCHNILTINDKGIVIFKMPLFVPESDVPHEDLSWVEYEYCPLFRMAGKLPQVRECTERMENFMMNHPEITKEQILAATTAYINNTHQNFIREPRYFISKQMKDGYMSDLLCWIDKIKEDDTFIQNSKTVIEG